MSYTYTTVQVTIANGETTSSVQNIEGYEVIGISTDAGYDGSTLSFQASPDDGTTWVTYLSPTALDIEDSEFYALTFPVAGPLVRLLAGSQTGATTITLYLRA